jgi:TolB-like protein/Flp pilus assembly protein TadD
MSGDPAQDRIADSLTEALIRELGRVCAPMPVLSPQTAFRYKGDRRPIGAIAEERRAAIVLDGALARRGATVWLTAQLVSHPRGDRLWADTLRYDSDDLLSLRNDLVESVARALGVHFEPRDRQRLARAPTIHIQAYAEYRQGRTAWNLRTREGLAAALECFRRSVEQDPGFDLAFVGLADSHNMLPLYCGLPPEENFAHAKAAARRALELDPTLAEAHASLAWALMSEWEWFEAEREYLRAIELNANYANARQWYGCLLAWSGRTERAFTEVRKALELDPLSAVIRTNLGLLHLWSAQYGAAIECLAEITQSAPGFPLAHAALGAAYAKTGKPDEALAAVRRANEISESFRHAGQLARIHASAGRKAEALTWMRRMAELAPADAQHAELASIYAALGEPAKAVAALELAVRHRDPILLSWKVDPQWEFARKDPQCLQILSCLGIPETR